MIPHEFKPGICFFYEQVHILKNAAEIPVPCLVLDIEDSTTILYEIAGTDSRRSLDLELESEHVFPCSKEQFLSYLETRVLAIEEEIESKERELQVLRTEKLHLTRQKSEA